jgi:hypothetical protein
MNIPVWQYVVSMGAYILFLLLLVEGMRRTPRLTTAIWILSLITAPLWASNLEGWFRWAKTLSVLVPTAIIVGGARFAWYYHNNTNKVLSFFRKDWTLKVLYAVLFLNIFEATAKDLVAGNYFNFICGAILCITIPFPRYKNGQRLYWAVSQDKNKDVLFFSTAAWNFLYTTWNLAFVFGENPGYFASSFCILMAAELYPIIKGRPELYITARIFTLAFHILARAVDKDFFAVMDSSSWANPSLVYYWGAVNLVLHVPYVIWYFNKKRNNPTGEPPCGDNQPLISEYAGTELNPAPAAKTATA